MSQPAQLALDANETQVGFSVASRMIGAPRDPGSAGVPAAWAGATSRRADDGASVGVCRA